MRRTVASFVLDEDVPLEKRRASMERVGKMPRPRRVEYHDTTVGGVPAIVATPTAVEPDRHVVYLHGGAYSLGSPRTHIGLCARLAKRAAATVSVIDYRLAPEHVFPAAIDDCVAAYRDVASRVDPASITIAGDSAGGGATLATLCALRDAGDRLPACAYVLSPWTDLTGSGDTVRTKADVDPMVKPGMLLSAARMYAGDDVALDHPGVSPLFADLSGLPPILIQTGADEVLLADSTRLADRLATAGVDHELDVQPGMWHVYQGFAGFMPEATAALVRAAEFVRARSPARVSA